jgi:hypothetical protein
MGEAIRCVGGQGAVYIEGEGVKEIGIGWERFIKPRIPHAFRPNWGDI